MYFRSYFKNNFGSVHNIVTDLIKIVDSNTKVEEVGNIVFDTVLYGLIFSNTNIEVLLINS